MAEQAGPGACFPYVYESVDGRATCFQILGADSQLVQVNLNPNDAVSSEPGAMCYMSDGIEMETSGTGFVEGLQRWFAGESFFTNTFVNKGNVMGYIAFAPPTFSRIVHLDLAQLGGDMLCQQNSYLCSVGDVKVFASIQRRVSVGIFGGEGFVLQRLKGSGLAFISASGTIVQRQLADGEAMVVDAGCTVAIAPTVDYRVQYVGSVKRALFGGEGLFYAHLKGPGLVMLQSLPHARYAKQMMQSGRGLSDERKPVASMCSVCSGILIMVLCIIIPLAMQFLVMYLEELEKSENEQSKKSKDWFKSEF